MTSLLDRSIAAWKRFVGKKAFDADPPISAMCRVVNDNGMMRVFLHTAEDRYLGEYASWDGKKLFRADPPLKTYHGGR